MDEQTQQGEQQTGSKKPPMPKIIAGVAALLVLAGAGYWAISSGAINLDNVPIAGSQKFVATVNGEGIEERLFNARFTQEKNAQESQGVVLNDISTEQLRQQVLDAMVNERLLVQYAKGQGVQVQDQQVEQQYEQVLLQIGGEEALLQQLQPQGTTLQDVKNEIADQIIIQDFANQYAQQQDVQVSEEEARQLYEDAVAGGEELPAFEELQEQIEGSLRNQKINQLLADLVNTLRQEAIIEIVS